MERKVCQDAICITNVNGKNDTYKLFAIFDGHGERGEEVYLDAHILSSDG